MKRTFLVFMVTVIIAVCLAGCQATPDSPVVIGKDGDLAVQAQQTAQPNNGASAATTTQSWQENYSIKDGVTVEFDFSCDTPEKLPAAKVETREFSEQDINTILTASFGTWEAYEDYPMTKEDIMEKILVEKQDLAKDTGEDFKATIQSKIDYYQQIYDSIPENATFTSIKPAFTAQDWGGGVSVQAMDYVIKANDKYYSLLAYNTTDGRSEIEIMPMLEYENNPTYEPMDLDTIKDMSLSEDDAVKEAKEIAAAMGCDLSFAAVHAGAYSLYDGSEGTEDEYEMAWRIVFAREVNGVSTTYDIKGVGGDESQENQDVMIDYETLIINIDENGFCGFSWTTPMELGEIVNDNVAVKSLDDIKEIVKNAIPQKMQRAIDGVGSDGCEAMTVRVTGARLGLMRVRDNSGYVMIPVWDIYATQDFSYTSEAGQPEEDAFAQHGTILTPGYTSFVTINAMDGSIIDRNLGY